MRKFRRKDGFTLIELMMTLAVLGILMSVALPYFSLVQAKSKRTEMFQGLGGVYSAEMAYFSTENTFAHQICVGSFCNCGDDIYQNWPNTLQVAGFSLSGAGKFFGFCVDIQPDGTFLGQAAGNIDQDGFYDWGNVSPDNRDLVFVCDDIADAGPC